MKAAVCGTRKESRGSKIDIPKLADDEILVAEATGWYGTDIHASKRVIYGAAKAVLVRVFGEL